MAGPARGSNGPTTTPPDSSSVLNAVRSHHLFEASLGNYPARKDGITSEYLSLNFGHLWNRSPRSGLGYTLTVQASEDVRYSVFGRGRLALASELMLDVSPGVWLSGRGLFDQDFSHWGGSLTVGLLWGGLLGVEAGVDAGKPADLPERWDWKLGVRTADQLSAAMLGGLLIVGILYATAISSPNY